jgi:hypothetical protein
MQTNGPIGVVDDKPTQRRHGRVSCELVRTAIGDVRNVSAEGMCVCAKSMHGLVPGKGVVIELAGTIAIRLNASVVWASRRGFRKYLIGFHFEGVSETQRRDLSMLARQCGRAQTIVTSRRGRAA